MTPTVDNTFRSNFCPRFGNPVANGFPTHIQFFIWIYRSFLQLPLLMLSFQITSNMLASSASLPLCSASLLPMRCRSSKLRTLNLLRQFSWFRCIPYWRHTLHACMGALYASIMILLFVFTSNRRFSTGGNFLNLSCTPS